MDMMEYASRTAREYYDPETYEHVCRVAAYVREHPMIPDEIREDCIALALMHDLLEDTSCSPEAFAEREDFAACLLTLTRPEGTDYITYIKGIRKAAADRPAVYWVKLADMKDHLARTETLTEKLRDKYMTALPYLL